jgi:hypothetical protein
MSGVGLFRARAMPGSVATSLHKEVAMSGCRGVGITHLIKEPVGFVPVIGTTSKAGS